MLCDELNDRCNAIEQAELNGDFELANELKIQFNDIMNETLHKRVTQCEAKRKRKRS